MYRFIVSFLAFLMSTLPVSRGITAEVAGFPAKAGIYLQSADGTEYKIGSVQFGEASNGQSGFNVDIDNSRFSEHFLSMRPFRCLQGDTEWFCYLPYPYDLQNVVRDDDLSDLEYNLLFIRKSPSEFGIDAWNGLYYKLVRESDGKISGTLFEGDLNVLQSPPDEKYAKPVDLDEFIEGDSAKRLYPSLIIY